MILADNVLDAAAGNVLCERPMLVERHDDFLVSAAVLLRNDDELDLLIRILADAHHFGKRRLYSEGECIQREGGPSTMAR